MELCKIVFTGGPCAGKTTQICMVKNYLKEKGYKVITVSETATDLINSGFDFGFINSLINFQTIMLKNQYFKEEMYSDVVKDRDEKIIILFDRGILDNKAYFENSRDFNYIMKNIDKSELEILDSYDLVIDLLSLASCNKEKYNITSNLARLETPEEAEILDEKTSNVWVGHNNLYLFNSNVSIGEEFKLIVDKIDSILNDTNVKEITQYEIDNKIEDFNKYNDNNSRLIKVDEMSLSNSNCVYRRTYKNSITYIYKSKKISFEEYLELINTFDITNIDSYDSLNFVRNKQLFEIKFYKDKTLLEYEENKLNDGVILPSEIKHCINKKKVLR